MLAYVEIFLLLISIFNVSSWYSDGWKWLFRGMNVALEFISKCRPLTSQHDYTHPYYEHEFGPGDF